MINTVNEAKKQAKALRNALAEKNMQISHSQALELLAQQQGERDWNTLCAGLQKNQSLPFKLGDTVTGRYMGQTFSGKLVSMAQKGIYFHVAIQLEKPIDTVTFDSFSNLRRNIRGTVNHNGVSLSHNSAGLPHLEIEMPN